ncbi:hypothetical protein [uncultured Tateyamaria sp.]|uniref:hypothetical protein n=1 Tax=uncultured Tateyamaria sp. TaxID=455651 RepID=UPI00263641A4|nr:hypothetical protein [uncultured Tateyamaria sp.]
MTQSAPYPARETQTRKTSQILRAFYTEIWEQAQFDRIEDYFVPSSTHPILVADRAVDVNEVREWMLILNRLVRDIKVRFIHAIDSGDWASAFLEITCSSRTDGKTVVVYQQIMSRQSGGLLVESYPQFDMLRFFEQLGQLPPDIYPLLMGGNRLT